jgi:GTPase SAR1 family protein
MYYREMSAGCIVYAIDDIRSFEAVQGWYNGFDEAIRANSKFYLVGNKRDLEGSRQVPIQRGEDLAAELGMSFAEVSAKTEVEEVRTLFERIAKERIESAANEATTDPLAPEPNPEPQSSDCC